MCDDRGIGKDGTIPWHCKTDLAFFANITRGNGNNAIVMGRKTWLSLGRPLPKRDNVVLSRSETIYHDKVCFCRSMDEVIAHCDAASYDVVWIIGGAQIYEAFLSREIVDECYITNINGAHECDTFFPVLGDRWKVVELDMADAIHKADAIRKADAIEHLYITKLQLKRGLS